MNKVVAALDNSLATTPVLATASALAELFGAEIQPVHVRSDGARIARSVAEAAGLRLRELHGPIVESLCRTADEPNVVALVVGARGTPTAKRPLGSTAVAVATGVDKPLAVVPPDAHVAPSVRRVLVPIEAASRSLTPRAIVQIARGTGIDVVALHVFDETTLPAFTDQPQHENEPRTREFLRRYCPWGIDTVQLEIRVGHVHQLVAPVADETNADLIALGWSQQLGSGRARVVQATLEQAHVPVLLLPVDIADAAAEAAADHGLATV
jgi:nucleotide-binding universal stress UspA family protein